MDMSTITYQLYVVARLLKNGIPLFTSHFVGQEDSIKSLLNPMKYHGFLWPLREKSRRSALRIAEPPDVGNASLAAVKRI